MESKEYYFDLFEHHIISFNEFWEDQLEKTELRNNTAEALDELESYFKLLNTQYKRLKKYNKPTNDYDTYPDIVKQTIDSIVNIVSDGRDLWHKVKYTHCRGSFLDGREGLEDTREYDHHVQKNGHLGFENEPWGIIDSMLSDIERIREILKSESKTGNFKKFINGKWYLFEGYESGSMSVRFDKINVNKKGEFTFDGDIVNYATVDSRFDGDGIIIQTECTNVNFQELPYCDGFSEEEAKDLEEFLNHVETVETTEELKESLHESLDSYIEGTIE